MWLLLQKTKLVTKQSFELDIELAAHVLLLCCLNQLVEAITQCSDHKFKNGCVIRVCYALVMLQSNI
jgi:hypothetical protein